MLLASCASLCLFSLNACAVGRNHTPDSRLEQRFLQRESEFERLLSDVWADKKLAMIASDRIRYAGISMSPPLEFSKLAGLGLRKERWLRFQRQLQELGMTQITKGDQSVEFRVDRGSIGNGDSYKGYWHSPTPPGHRKESLDRYRISAEDKDRFGGFLVCKPIKPTASDLPKGSRWGRSAP